MAGTSSPTRPGDSTRQVEDGTCDLCGQQRPRFFHCQAVFVVADGWSEELEDEHTDRALCARCWSDTGQVVEVSMEDAW